MPSNKDGHESQGSAPTGPTVSERDALRNEIVETEKLQADAARWKLIAVAAIVSAACGAFTGSAAKTQGTESLPLQIRELLYAVPAVCCFSDLFISHLMMRILVIGAYLRRVGDRYEWFCHNLRSMRHDGHSTTTEARRLSLSQADIAQGKGLVNDPFEYEWWATFGTSIGMNLLVIIAEILFMLNHPAEIRSRDWIVITICVLGIVVTGRIASHLKGKIRALDITSPNALLPPGSMN